MNGLERIFATIQGNPTDHPAVTLTLSLYGARLIRCPLNEYYTRSDAYVEGQLAVKETFEPDILFTPFALTAEGEAFGSQVRFFEKNPPNISKPAAGSVEDALRLTLPDVENHPRLCFIREATRGMAAHCANDTAIAGIMLSPIDLPPLFMGVDGWLEALLFDENAARRILEMTTQFFISWSSAFFADGAHVIALPIVFCNPNIVTEHIIRNIAMPVLEEAFHQARGPIILHHGGATILPFLELLTHLPNVIGYAIDQRDELRTARKIVGKDKLLLGNIDGPTLHTHSPEEIHHAACRILNDRRDDPHFVLASSAADVAFDTPPENIRAVIRAARDGKNHEK